MGAAIPSTQEKGRMKAILWASRLSLANSIRFESVIRTPTAKRKRPEDLRSARWFAPDHLRGFGHRSRIMQMGYAPEDWVGQPVIAILNTWSDINPCHAHFKQRVEDVKRGVLQAGGIPIELPAISLAENFVKPTTMLYRNMLAMDTEELIRSHPVDGVVLMGCSMNAVIHLIAMARRAGHDVGLMISRLPAARFLSLPMCVRAAPPI
jgi:dihydroxyacid dehydratase/phosphogluconate dehydratase